jgi:hypothetical protein
MGFFFFFFDIVIIIMMIGSHSLADGFDMMVRPITSCHVFGEDGSQPNVIVLADYHVVDEGV